MIIDVHGHFTTAPPALQQFRDQQLAALGATTARNVVRPQFSDEVIRERISSEQLRSMQDRGEDFMLISPKASAMQHHVADQSISTVWAQVNNDLIRRVTDLFPESFAGVCQLPQTPGGSLDEVIRELERCVRELGFVGCLLNPDPSGGSWTSAPLTDPYWFPLFERMVELRVPAMIHVSESCVSSVDTLGAYYLAADTTIFAQLQRGDLFTRFPTLRLVLPHGGGAAPYHWGRYQGLAIRYGIPGPDERMGDNVFFDTAVYHRPGMALLFEVVDSSNLLFASEMLGAVRGINPESSRPWDDTRVHIDALGLSAEAQFKVYEGNALRVFPRLSERLAR